MADKNNINSRNRRAVLQTISATGLSIAGFAGTVTAHRPEQGVEELEHGEKRKVIASIVSSREVKTLRKSLDQTVRPRPQTGRVFQVIGGNKEYRFATIQFTEPGQESSSVFLTWNDKDDDSIPSFVITEYDSDELLERRSYIKNGKVIEYESSGLGLPPELTAETSRNVNIQATTDPDECVSYVTEECNDVNWSCLAQIGVIYGSCATAVMLGSISGVIWCLASSGVSLWQVADDENCSLCDSSSLREVEICGAPSSP